MRKLLRLRDEGTEGLRDWDERRRDEETKKAVRIKTGQLFIIKTKQLLVIRGHKLVVVEFAGRNGPDISLT